MNKTTSGHQLIALLFLIALTALVAPVQAQEQVPDLFHKSDQCIACHTGRESCFYRQLQGDKWVEVEQVLKDPKQIYSK